jgi:tetratricopeptide (TPR) repeat protein
MNAHAHSSENRSKASLAWTAVALLVVMVGAAGCDKLKARDQLNKGVAAFKNGQYDASVENFKEAKDLDPNLLNARLYLATAYATEYIPGAPSDDNIRLANQAIAEFQDVLSKDPNNLSAIDGIGSILYNMAGTPFTPEKFAESKTYHMKHIAINPNDPEPYYWVGVIDWTLAYRGDATMRQAYNVQNPKKQLKDIDPLPDKLRADFAQQYGMLVDEGLQMIQKAVELRSDYADAMAYQNLLLRQKADQSDTATRAALEKQADDLLDKVKDIKQKQAEAAAAKS